MDWPAWCHSGVGPLPTLLQYKAYVKHTLLIAGLPAWKDAAARHASHIPYEVFMTGRNYAMETMRRRPIDWNLQFGVRSWCRLRAGLLRLCHRNGRTSDARVQSCILCNRAVRNPLVHVLGVCEKYTVCRQETLGMLGSTDASPQRCAVQVLQVMPDKSVTQHHRVMQIHLTNAA